MNADEFDDRVSELAQAAVLGGADLDDVESTLEQALGRVERARAMEVEA